MTRVRQDNIIALPKPRTTSKLCVEEALRKRRTVRSYLRQPLNLAEISQLLWAAQGLTDRDGNRTAPSAGQTHPIEVYLAAWNVEDLPPGIYHYVPRGHGLERLSDREVKAELAEASSGQEWIADGAAVFVLVGVPERARELLGDRCTRMVHMEAGHVSENIFLQSLALRLGNAFVGRFEEEKVRAIIGLPESELPLALMPVGRKR
jgi:SagB-type dehydrogenase family enzyme